MRALLKILIILLLAGFMGCKRNPPKLQDVFSDLSIGIPAYQSVEAFEHPSDAIRGSDYFSLDFTQSSNQFRAFISKLGITQTNALSPAGAVHVPVTSKTSPKYPWFLTVRANPLDESGQRYRVQVVGRQPYN